MDVGLPVQTAPDGRRYKPLMAIMVRDMDGRLNLNAHSSWRHSPYLPDDPMVTTTNMSRFLKVAAPFAIAGSPAAYRLRVGQGYGPAEISLSPIFSPYPVGTETLTGAMYTIEATPAKNG